MKRCDASTCGISVGKRVSDTLRSFRILSGTPVFSGQIRRSRRETTDSSEVSDMSHSQDDLDRTAAACPFRPWRRPPRTSTSFTYLAALSADRTRGAATETTTTRETPGLAASVQNYLTLADSRTPRTRRRDRFVTVT
jgi:hypothetical protein